MGLCFLHPRLKQALYWLIPGLAFLYMALGVSRLDGPDLSPFPDAEEYALLARQLAQFKAPLISVGLHDYPSRYSLTYPLLLAPFAWLTRLDLTQMHWTSLFFGLLAVIMMARTGGRLLGSRLAGGLAALFFALHPQTIWAASVIMSELAIIAMFFLMLDLARPWLAPDDQPATPESKSAASISRALALGLVLGWLTLAKAPFAYWAAVLTALVAGRAMVQRRYAPLAALVLAGGACALADTLYRRWAFGSWSLNGYSYWFPVVYAEPLLTFHWKYLLEPWDITAPAGNLKIYAGMLLGRTGEFYPLYMGATALVAGGCLFWPRRRGYPRWGIVGLLTGWFVVGLLFCGLYFFQCPRFPHLWIPAVDLLVAWGLVQVPRSPRIARWRWGRIRTSILARGLALIVVLLLLRGEYRRVATTFYHLPEKAQQPFATQVVPLLAKVPAGAWLLTNYQVPIVQQERSTPGPTGTLYTYYLDAIIMSSHAYSIDCLGLRSRRLNPEMAPWQDEIPPTWRKTPTVLIGLEKNWQLPPNERRTLFSQPVYLLLARPAILAVSGQYLDEVILPLLRQELTIEPVATEGEVVLYKAMNRLDRPTAPRLDTAPSF